MTESTSASAFIANESHMLFPASFSFFSTVPQAIIVGIDEHWKPAYWNEAEDCSRKRSHVGRCAENLRNHIRFSSDADNEDHDGTD